MGGTGVIDTFLGVFTSYIDSGFGLLGGEVAFIASTLIVIDVTLAALFWAWGADDDIIPAWHGEKLFEASPAPKFKLIVPGAGHNDLAAQAGEAYWRAFTQFALSLPQAP